MLFRSEAPQAFGLCVVLMHLLCQPFSSGLNHFFNYKLKMYVGMGDHSDTHLCLWWKRKKSLKYAIFGSILPASVLMLTVGWLMNAVAPHISGGRRTSMIRMTVATSRILLPGFACKVLNEKEKVFSCAISSAKF